MAQGGFPGDPGEAEKARYRRKLSEWRSMGFEVSALEVLLETDLEKFKEKRFELMRNQIHGAGPAPPAGPKHPQVVPLGQPQPPARRPGLHSHFVRPAGVPGEAPAPSGEPAEGERLHSEMRYPSVKRRRPPSDMKTFSVAVEHERGHRGIVVGEKRRPASFAKAPPPGSSLKAAPRSRPAPPLRNGERPEMAVEEDETPGAEEEPEIQVEEEGGSEEHLRRAGEEGDHLTVEEESGEPAEGPKEPEDDPADDEGTPGEEEAPDEAEENAGEEEAAGREPEPQPSMGNTGSKGRDLVKRRARQRPDLARTAEADAARGPPAVRKKIKKVAAAKPPVTHGRRPPYGWIAVLVVLMLVIAGYGAWSQLSPKTTVTARASFPATAESGALVSFDGGNSSSTGKGIVRYDWTFGDGASGTGRRVAHFYSLPGTNTVTLTVEDQDGTRSAPFSSRLTILALSVSVPPKKFNDRANYAVNGTVDVKNTDSYLYKVNVGTQQVTVSEVELNFTGTLNQMVRDQHQEKDGFGASHSAVWTTSNEVLSLFGRAFTNVLTVTMNGDLTYFEDSYADAATGGVFQVQSRARTSLRLQSLPTGPNSINSTDSLRAYPGVAGMAGQFLPENIYKGKTFSQTEGPDNGTFGSGNVNYTWTRMGIKNIGGMASLGLNITAERSYLDRNGFSEFYLNVWISGSSSMPTSVLVHVKGRSGDTTYATDHLATITEFKAGSGAIDSGAQNFDTDPLPPELFSSPFVDVPADGQGNSSLRFGPGQARQEAAAKDGTFSQFLADNPRAYAVAAKYFEGQLGPGSATWNLTFSWPGASTGYWVNVTRDILQKYNVRGDWLAGPPEVQTGEDMFGRMLTMSSAEGRMRGNDTETATTFFKGGAVNWAGGTSLELGSDPVYPGINLASLYASGERAGYGVMLKKEGYTSAFAMDTGQMMYFYTHSSV